MQTDLSVSPMDYNLNDKLPPKLFFRSLIPLAFSSDDVRHSAENRLGSAAVSTWRFRHCVRDMGLTEISDDSIGQ